MDCYVKDPLGKTIYRETKKQYDSFTHRAEVKGVYQFCFSNEFSTFSHKTVYFDFQVGDEPPILPDMGKRVTALTQVSGRRRPRDGTPTPSPPGSVSASPLPACSPKGRRPPSAVPLHCVTASSGILVFPSASQPSPLCSVVSPKGRWLNAVGDFLSLRLCPWLVESFPPTSDAGIGVFLSGGLPAPALCGSEQTERMRRPPPPLLRTPARE